jgi:hypothetical protein
VKKRNTVDGRLVADGVRRIEDGLADRELSEVDAATARVSSLIFPVPENEVLTLCQVFARGSNGSLAPPRARAAWREGGGLAAWCWVSGDAPQEKLT